MTHESTDPTPTRMLFLGDAALTDGFQLIGFETWPDPGTQQLEQVIGELLNTRTNAFVILDCRLAEKNARILERVRAEGGRIVVTVVPPLNEPDRFCSQIDKQVKSMLGSEQVMEQAE